MEKAYNNFEENANKDKKLWIGDPNDPCNIDGSSFSTKCYLDKLLAEKDLSDLLAKESEIVEQIRSLDSEMQTLVYDNYNRFIYATDTIKMMKTDFRFVETEMNSLSSKIADIKNTANELKDTLHNNRDEIKRIAGTQETLKRLEYLLNLPNTLRECMNDNQWSEAISHYQKAKNILKIYAETPGFQVIAQECETLINELIAKSKSNFNISTTPADCLVMMELLKKLNIPMPELYSLYIEKMQVIFDNTFAPASVNFNFNYMVKSLNVLHDNSCNFVRLFIIDSSYEEKNIHSIELRANLLTEITRSLKLIINIVQGNLKSFDADGTLLAKSVSSLYLDIDNFTDSFINLFPDYLLVTREYFSENLVYPQSPMKELLSNMVLIASKHNSASYLTKLKRLTLEKFDITKKQISQYLFSQQQMKQIKNSPSNPFDEVDNDFSLPVSLQNLKKALETEVKDAFDSMKTFLDPSKSYTSKVEFHVEFCAITCREDLIVAYFDFLMETAINLTQLPHSAISAEFLILFARILDIWAVSGTVGNILSMIDDILLPKTGNTAINIHPSIMEPESRKMINLIITKMVKPLSISGPISQRLKKTSLLLCSSAARQKGFQIGSLLQKSVETRDWLKSAEPRSVRSIIKRVLDVDLAIFNHSLSLLLSDESGTASTKIESTSEMSYKASTFGNGSYVMPTQLRHLFAGNKIDFCEETKLNRDSILTTAIRTALKTFVECVRMKTFSKFGLQQMQLDCHCLKVNLEPLVSNPAIIRMLLEEVMHSIQQRCTGSSDLLQEKLLNGICTKS